MQKHSGISVEIINNKKSAGKNINIVPALLINDELFSYGDIDESRLLSRLYKKFLPG